MNPETLHPALPENCSFAPAADALLENGQVDEAWRLCRVGVAAHPLYATGHIVLG